MIELLFCNPRSELHCYFITPGQGWGHLLISYNPRSGLGSPTDISVVREATAALQSVFPQTELGTFMSLTKRDKVILQKPTFSRQMSCLPQFLGLIWAMFLASNHFPTGETVERVDTDSDRHQTVQQGMWERWRGY